MHALRNLVRDAYPGDAFVFFCEHIFTLRFSRPFFRPARTIRRWTLRTAARYDRPEGTRRP